MQRQAALTMVETLATMAIFAVLVAVATPVFAGVREKSRQGVCAQQLRQIHTALSLYSNDHGNLSPVGLSYLPMVMPSGLLAPYGLDLRQCVCPNSRALPPSSSYQWRILALGPYDGIDPT